MKYLIAYIVFAVIFESIHLIIAWKNFKKELEKKEQIKMFLNVMKQIFLQSASMRAFKEKIWNWYTISFIGVPMLIFISPFALPISLLVLTKKALGIKSKLEKEAEVEAKAMEEAKKKSEEFMKNEGEMINIIEGEEIKEDLKDDLNNNNNDNIEN